MKVIGFYSPDNRYGCFSNWYASDFSVDGTKYWCAEQYMMQQKALMFDAPDTADKIMCSVDQGEIKRLGRTEIPDYNDAIWDKSCQRIMRKGLKCKFLQNDTLKAELLSTDSAILAECAPNDHKWGIGLDISDQQVHCPHQWCGRNLLGYTLMQVREDIRSIEHGTKHHKLPYIDISIEETDITELAVDVIVNAANKSLLGGGGVDGAIHRAAGPKLLEECKTLHGASTGEVKITDGYNLSAKKIIHTPGPIWKGGNNHEAGKLANCWRRALCLAMENDLHSIAFPSISTGVYGFPLCDAAKIAMTECVEFTLNNPSYKMKIIVAAFDNETLISYQEALYEAMEYAVERVPVEDMEIENNAIKTIDIKKAFAFKIASGGAMGVPGGVELFVDDVENCKIFYGNFAYGNLDIDSLMKHLKFHKMDFGMFGDASNIPVGWRYVDLGMGNSLLVRDHIFNILRYEYKKLEPHEIYGRYRNDVLKAQYIGEV